MNIPLVDLRSQQAEIADEVRVALDEVFANTAFVGGPAVARFEEEYAAFSEIAHCVGVANGTDALELALRGAGISAGDEVIVPANTFIATAEAVSRIGAVVVPVDVDEEHLLIDPERVAEAITPRTRAIMPVHLFGQFAPIEQLLPLVDGTDIVIIEDAAQSQGARRHDAPVASSTIAAATSFYPGKNLGAAGDAGAVTTNDPELADLVRVLAAHGSPAKYVHDVIGMNSRLDAVQAVVLRAKLARLEKWNQLRREAAQRYEELLAGLSGVRTPQAAEGNDDVWHLYVVRVEERDRVLAELNAAGVGAGIHYPTPVHLTRAYAGLGLGEGTYPVAESAADRILSLPMFPHLSLDQQEHVVATLTAAVRTAS